MGWELTKLCVCVCFLCTCVRVHMEVRSIGTSRTRIIRGCEQAGMDLIPCWFQSQESTK